MSAPARAFASTAARALPPTAAPAARPRRANKRTARSAVDKLAALYHLAPTFVPAHDPARLAAHVTHALASPEAIQARPHLHDLRDVVHAQILLDGQRVYLDASASRSTSLVGVDASLSPHSPSGYPELRSDGHQVVDHRASFYDSFVRGAEPPLAGRIRRLIDALHGTTAGGRAGPATLQEQGERAVKWREGLVQARKAAAEQDRVRDQEAQAFADQFEQDERR